MLPILAATVTAAPEGGGVSAALLSMGAVLVASVVGHLLQFLRAEALKRGLAGVVDFVEAVGVQVLKKQGGSAYDAFKADARRQATRQGDDAALVVDRVVGERYPESVKVPGAQRSGARPSGPPRLGGLLIGVV